MRALVVGGSSGIGLSIVLYLVGRDDYDRVYVLDKTVFPEEYMKEKIIPIVCNLSLGDFSCLGKIKDIDALFITAGFGHLKFFQDLSEPYITTCFAVNAIAPIRIVHHFYDRLLAKNDFYCAIMVSIAGRLSSPLFSVYSATKAALSKFIEAVNVELDIQGSNNRILEVSPGSILGTGFSGGRSCPEMTATLAEEIFLRTMSHEELFIPLYEEVFKDVIKRYQSDAHLFGVESYWYKKNREKQD